MPGGALAHCPGVLPRRVRPPQGLAALQVGSRLHGAQQRGKLFWLCFSLLPQR